MREKLEEFVMQRQVLRDPETRREVWQMTDGEFDCIAPYMDVLAWSRDDRYIVFMSNRTGLPAATHAAQAGSWQPYRLEVETGQVAQLLNITDGNPWCVAVSPKGDEAYCTDGPRFVAVNLYTLERRTAADFSRLDLADGKVDTNGAVFNRDGSLVVREFACPTNERRDLCERGIIVATSPASGGGGSNQFEVVRPKKAGPMHTLVCPSDDKLLSYHAMPDRQNDLKETPEHRTALWRIHRKTGEEIPLVFMPPGFRATHSLWGKAGQRYYFHRKTVPPWVPTALCSVDRSGGDLRVYYETSDHKLGHSCPSPDEQWIITDSQDPGRNILMLVHIPTGKGEVICWPNSSIKANESHVHPSWSRSGRHVIYTSDVTGKCQVYVVPVGDLVA
jgi:oligogalacturonide lyase